MRQGKAVTVSLFFPPPSPPHCQPHRHYPRAFCTLPSFARIKRPRWRPVELNNRHLRSHGKIGNCEQSSTYSTMIDIVCHLYICVKKNILWCLSHLEVCSSRLTDISLYQSLTNSKNVICWQYSIVTTRKVCSIGPLHDPVTWQGINYTGMQIMQWDFPNKGKSGWTGMSSFVLEVPLRNLRPNVIYSVPCDRIVLRAYFLNGLISKTRTVKREL